MAVQDGADLRLGKFKPGKGRKLVQLDKLTYQGKTKSQLEKEAITKINDATLAGIKNGETASKKLH